MKIMTRPSLNKALKFLSRKKSDTHTRSLGLQLEVRYDVKYEIYLNNQIESLVSFCLVSTAIDKWKTSFFNSIKFLLNGNKYKKSSYEFRFLNLEKPRNFYIVFHG